MLEEELEEGEAPASDAYEDACVDPDISFSYIDEKLQSVLGHFQKDFEGGLSAENLGAKFGGYGSFLPADTRAPPVLVHSTIPSHQKSTSPKSRNYVGPRNPPNLSAENAHRNTSASVNSDSAAAPKPLASSLDITQMQHSVSEEGRHGNSYNLLNNAANGREQKPPLKVRIKGGNDNTAIYNGLGLLTSPYSSMDDSPNGSSGGSPEFSSIPGESPRTILQVMTNFTVPGGLLMSPLQENVVLLLKRGVDHAVNCSSGLFSSNPDDVDPIDSTFPPEYADAPLAKKVKLEEHEKMPVGGKNNGTDGPNVLMKREIDIETHAGQKIVRDAIDTALLCTQATVDDPRNEAQFSVKSLVNPLRPANGLQESRNDQLSGGKCRRGSVKAKADMIEAIGNDRANNLETNKKEKGHAEANVCQKELSKGKVEDPNRFLPDLQLATTQKVEGFTFTANVNVVGSTCKTNLVGRLMDDNKVNLSQESSTDVISKNLEILNDVSGHKMKGKESDCSQNVTRAKDNPCAEVLDRKRAICARNGRLEGEGNIANEIRKDRVPNVRKGSYGSSTSQLSDGNEVVVVKDEAQKGKFLSEQTSTSNRCSIEFAPSTEVAASSIPPVVIQEHWVACDLCQKWRLLPFDINPDSLPKIWQCSMLNWLPGMNKCEISQEETTKALNALYMIPAPSVAPKDVISVVDASLRHSLNPEVNPQSFGRSKVSSSAQHSPERKSMSRTVVDPLSRSSDFIESQKIKQKVDHKELRRSSDGGNAENLERVPESKRKRMNSQSDRDSSMRAKAEEESLNTTKTTPSKSVVRAQMENSHISLSKETNICIGHTAEVKAFQGKASKVDDEVDLSNKDRPIKQLVRSDDPLPQTSVQHRKAVALTHEAANVRVAIKDRKIHEPDGKPSQVNAKVGDTSHAQNVPTAASSPSKISGSRRSKALLLEARDSPVGSVSSSPLKICSMEKLSCRTSSERDEQMKGKSTKTFTEKRTSDAEFIMFRCSENEGSQRESLQNQSLVSQREFSHVEPGSSQGEKGCTQLPSRVVSGEQSSKHIHEFSDGGQGHAVQTCDSTLTYDMSKKPSSVAEKKLRDGFNRDNPKGLPSEPAYEHNNPEVLLIDEVPQNSRHPNVAQAVLHNSSGRQIPCLTDCAGNTKRDANLAASVYKEARELKHKSNRLKDEGKDVESVDLCFEAALKFMQVAFLLEPSNVDSSKHGDSSQSMKMYSETANLCRVCADKYELHQNMVAAALAHKCVEVAYLKAAYFKQPSARRDHHELQATLQTAAPGESPSSSASDIDNLIGQGVSKPVSVKDSNSPNTTGSNAAALRNRSHLTGLLTYVHDFNCAFEATRRSQAAVAAAAGRTEVAAHVIAAARRVLDFNFHNVREILRLVRVSMDALGH